ncbi:unnamed protein product [Symbiodinium natans]|uniref:Uncharacterized protein n=1 Tax=Symbiodinium natans TaxID=878477 RepID=A0A812R626_9DINO|nr:unnamed protein product [Symbiodinium natans]
MVQTSRSLLLITASQTLLWLVKCTTILALIGTKCTTIPAPMGTKDAIVKVLEVRGRAVKLVLGVAVELVRSLAGFGCVAGAGMARLVVFSMPPTAASLLQPVVAPCQQYPFARTLSLPADAKRFLHSGQNAVWRVIKTLLDFHAACEIVGISDPTALVDAAETGEEVFQTVFGRLSAEATRQNTSSDDLIQRKKTNCAIQ